MQKIVDTFWDGTQSNEIRKAAFDQYVSTSENWKGIGKLYLYLWRSNGNAEPNNNRYNMDLRKQILTDPFIIQGIQSYYIELNKTQTKGAAPVPLMRERLIKAWKWFHIGVDKPIDSFQTSILELLS